jgi:signal transduction histidine kinase
MKIGIRTVFLLLLATIAGSEEPSQVRTLTDIASIRNLTPEEASRAYPVRLSAVVVFSTPPLFFIHDGKTSIFGQWPFLDAPPAPGDRIDVAGETWPGQFAPVVNLTRVEVVGHGAMPEARRVSVDELLSGAYDAQWVELDDLIVHGVEPDVLHVAAGQREFTIWVRETPFSPLPTDLLDARVRVRGVASTSFDELRQFRGFGLNVPSHKDVIVLERGLAEPFEQPIRAIGSLFRFSLEGMSSHFVHIQGVVLFTTTHSLYVRDDTGIIEARTREAPTVKVGDRAEVAGFPSVGEYPALHDAVVRAVGRASLPAPIPVIDPRVVLTHHYARSYEWIQIDGELLDDARVGGDDVLTLRRQDVVFTARLATAGAKAWATGSRLRLVGVWKTEFDDRGEPRAFQVLVGSPKDVTVLARPPWLRLEHLAAVLVVGVLVHFVRMRQLRARFGAVVEERGRMARELHDTLDQNLTGVMIQLDLMSRVRKSEPSDAHLQEARELVRGAMSEAGRLVRNLRLPGLEQGGLRAALPRLAERVERASEVSIDLAITGTERRMSEDVENHLLRITQEALTNAIRHGHAKRIRVVLALEPSRAGLLVKDDGRGFAAGTDPASAGHFGILGMRERVGQMQGELSIESEVGIGTTVTVVVPVRSFAS